MKTIFQETLGDSPQIKILDFLMENQRCGWTLVELRDNSKVGYSTLKIMLPELLKKELVIIDKKVGKSNLYKINLKNPAIKHLMKFDWSITKQEALKIK